jgi:hypothetical protein
MRMLVWDPSEPTTDFIARQREAGWAPAPENITRPRLDGHVDWQFYWVGPGDPPA